MVRSCLSAAVRRRRHHHHHHRRCCHRCSHFMCMISRTRENATSDRDCEGNPLDKRLNKFAHIRYITEHLRIATYSIFGQYLSALVFSDLLLRSILGCRRRQRLLWLSESWLTCAFYREHRQQLKLNMWWATGGFSSYIDGFCCCGSLAFFRSFVRLHRWYIFSLLILLPPLVACAGGGMDTNLSEMVYCWWFVCACTLG